MRILNWVLILLFVIAGITFACINAQEVSFNYYSGIWNGPLAVLLVAAMTCGFVLSCVTFILAILGLKLQALKQTRKLTALSKELSQLRLLAVKDGL